MTPTSERGLLAEAAAGSSRAFTEIADRHQQAVRTFLRRVCGERSDIDDIAQETFLAAWAQAGRYRGGAALRTWLCAIAWRKARDAQRAAGRRRARDHAFAEAQSLSRQGPGPDSADLIAVQQTLMTLPLDQRAAVALCLGGEFSNAEAAEILSLPLGTVRSHVQRGRAKLLQALGDQS